MQDTPRIVAHRGGSCLYPENSIGAFTSAVSLGVDAIELDVHLSADSVPVVMHDAHLDQTSNGSGEISKMTAADLAQIDLRQAGGHVPTLEEAFACGSDDTEFLVEIKRDAARGRYAGIEEAIVETARAAGAIARVTVIGFDQESLMRVREIDPSVRICLSFSRMFRPDPRDDRSVADDLVQAGFAAIMVFSYEVTSTMVETMRAGGLELGVWTPNGPARLDYWMRQDVDFVITDQPDLALEIRRRLR